MVTGASESKHYLIKKPSKMQELPFAEKNVIKDHDYEMPPIISRNELDTKGMRLSKDNLYDG